MQILIAGGGIGGLTSALCALHFGHEVTVFEQSTRSNPVGAGLQLSPNAMVVYRALGLEDALKSVAFRPEALEMRLGLSGRPVFKIPLAESPSAPYLHIHRADYTAVLERALSARAPNALKRGAKITRYTQDDNGVSVTLEDGRQFQGDCLIGADGIHSVIRAQMLGPDKAKFTGNIAWRAVMPTAAIAGEVPDPTACAWVGAGRHAVTYHLGGDKVNFVGVVESTDWQSEAWTEPGALADLRTDFGGWYPIIQSMIEAVEPTQLYRWALFDRPPSRQWCDGRVALLGDAIHPMLPFLAQGAAMAVEDSWALFDALSEGSLSVPQALLSYQHSRLPRASRVQAASKANMKTFHKRGAVSQALTYGPMWLAGKLAVGYLRTRLDWLYNYDVTKGD